MQGGYQDDDADDSDPVFVIKKKRSTAGKPRTKLSSLVDSSPPPPPAPTATPATKEQAATDGQTGDDAEGNTPVFRSRVKKSARSSGLTAGTTPRGASATATATTTTTARSRISFGGEAEAEDDGPVSFVKRSTSASALSAASGTPRRSLLRPNAMPSASGSSKPAVESATTAAPTATPTAHEQRSVYSKEYLDELKRGQMNSPRGGTAVAGTATTSSGFDDLTKSKFGADQLQDSTELPSSQQIERARQRREELRKAGLAAPVSRGGGGDDENGGFISLQVGFANKGGESRLVREEDEIGDGDEDMAAFTDSLSRLPLGKRANALAARRMREEMGEMIDDVEMDVRDQDDEMREWEEAQIRRAGGGRDDVERGRGAEGKGGKDAPYRAAPIPQSSTLPSISAVSARLSAALQSLTTSHALERSALDHFEKERSELDTQERELREEVVKTEEKNRWFGDFKDEVEDWSAFLDEKFPQLERIEAILLSIQRERTEIVSRRRFADDADDVALFTGAPIAPAFKLPSAAATSEDQQDMPMSDATLEEDLPPRSVARTTRRAERERRYRERARPATAPAEEQTLGYDSDADLSAGDRSDLQDALTAAERDLAALFADVKAPEFRDPNLVIRKRFEEWRERYGDEYGMTFAGLSLAQVWEFWARVEMARWNPFELDELPRTPSDLAAYQWHQALSTYGHKERLENGNDDDEEEEEEADESTEVVNAIVASVAIPRLSTLARQTYDPYSSRQTTAALRLVDEISYCVETNSPKFGGLIYAFFFRLRMAVAAQQSLVLPHLANLSVPALAFDPSTFTARLSFLRRSLKLLRTCQRWRRFMRALRIPVVPEQVAQGASAAEDGLLEVGAGATFDELVQREFVARTVLPVVEAAWASGGDEIAKQMIEALPKDIPPALRRRLEGENIGQV